MQTTTVNCKKIEGMFFPDLPDYSLNMRSTGAVLHTMEKKFQKIEMSRRSIEIHCRMFQYSMPTIRRVIEQKHVHDVF